MAKHTSISIGDHFARFVNQQVKSGRFGTASEVVRAGLRLLEEEEQKMAALRKALDEGEQSGIANDYSLGRVLERARRRTR